MDRFDAMEAFVSVAELRSFSAAARKLGLSAPAVTRAVAALEERLQIRLLQRTTRSVTLTDSGARYLERARRIVADVGEAEQAARAERTEPAGRFVVTAPNVFGRREVAPLMRDFLAQHPAVIAELTLTDRFMTLVEEGIDLAVRIGVLEDSSLRVRPVGATRRVIVGSPKYLARKKKLRRPSDLAAHEIIQVTPLTATPEWRFVRNDQEERIAFRPTFLTNSADAAIAHAEHGGGLALVLSYQVVDKVKAGALQIVLPKYEEPPLPISLVYPGARLPSANVRAFVDLIAATRNWSFLEL